MTTSSPALHCGAQQRSSWCHSETQRRAQCGDRGGAGAADRYPAANLLGLATEDPIPGNEIIIVQRGALA